MSFEQHCAQAARALLTTRQISFGLVHTEYSPSLQVSSACQEVCLA